MQDQITTVTEQNGNSICADACPNITTEALLSLGPQNRYGAIPTIRLFLHKYGTYPCSLDCQTDDDDICFHATTIFDYMHDELNHDINKDCIARKYHRRTKQKYVESRVSDLGNGIMIDFTNSHLDSEVQNPNKRKADHGNDYFLIVSEFRKFKNSIRETSFR